MSRWLLTSKAFSDLVTADDQFEAWDTLRERPITDFGLIVQAERDEDGDPIAIRTSALMLRWNRDEAARDFVMAGMVLHGWGDTTELDKAIAGRV